MGVRHTLIVRRIVSLGFRTGRLPCAKNVVESLLAYRAQMSKS